MGWVKANVLCVTDPIGEHMLRCRWRGWVIVKKASAETRKKLFLVWNLWRLGLAEESYSADPEFRRIGGSWAIFETHRPEVTKKDGRMLVFWVCDETSWL